MTFEMYKNRLFLFFLINSALLIPDACLGLTDDDDAVAVLYEEALVQFNQDEVDTTIIHLKNVLRQNPLHLSAHILLGRSYLRNGKIEAAEEAFEYANSRGADNSLIAKFLARIYLLQKRPDKIFDSFDLGRYGQHDRGEMLVFHGYAYMQMDLPDKAEHAFRQANELLPDERSPLIGRAMLLSRLGRFEEALEKINSARELDPNESDVWHTSASIHHALGNLEKAVVHYSKAIELNPKYFDAMLARAGVLLDLRRDQQARKDLDTLREKYPFDPRSAYLSAVLMERLGEPEAASKALEQAAAIFDKVSDKSLDKDAQSLFLAGLVNYSLRRFERSLVFLNRYIKQFPERASVRKLIGSIFIAKKEFYKAIEVLEPALRYSTTDYELLALMGHAEMRVGDYAMASELLEKAVKLDATNPDLQRTLGVAKLGEGGREQALEALETSFKLDEKQTHAGLLVGVLYLKRGEPGKARQVAKKIIAREPKNLTAINLLASAQIADGKRDDGRSNYEKIAALDSSFLPARFNLGKLDLAEGKIDAARSRFLSVLDENPKNTRAMIELAKVEQSANRPEKSIRWLEKARSLDARLLPARIYLVDLYLTTGQVGKALQIAEQAEALAPKNQKALEQLGRSLLASNKVPMARVIFRRMAKYVGSDAQQLYRIALYQLKGSDEKEAIWNLSQAVSADPKFVQARIALAKELLDSGDPEKALNHALEVKKQIPEKADGFVLMAMFYSLRGDYHEALKEFQAALERKNDLSLVLKIYQIHEKTGRTEQGIEFLQDWAARNPQSVLAKKALAEVLLGAGRMDEALENYEVVLERNPNDADVLNNMAFILDGKNDVKALDLARAAYESSPESAFVNDTLGWLLVKNGEARSGLKYLRFAHSRAANDPEIRFHTAVALSGLNRSQEAITELEAILGKTIPSAIELEAQKLLTQLQKEPVN